MRMLPTIQVPKPPLVVLVRVLDVDGKAARRAAQTRTAHGADAKVPKATEPRIKVQPDISPAYVRRIK